MHRGSICDGNKWAEVKELFPDAGRKTQKVLKKLVKKHDVVYVCPPNGDIVLHNFSHQIDFATGELVGKGCTSSSLDLREGGNSGWLCLLTVKRLVYLGKAAASWLRRRCHCTETELGRSCSCAREWRYEAGRAHPRFSRCDVSSETLCIEA